MRCFGTKSCSRYSDKYKVGLEMITAVPMVEYLCHILKSLCTSIAYFNFKLLILGLFVPEILKIMFNIFSVFFFHSVVHFVGDLEQV